MPLDIEKDHQYSFSSDVKYLYQKAHIVSNGHFTDQLANLKAISMLDG